MREEGRLAATKPMDEASSQRSGEGRPSCLPLADALSRFESQEKRRLPADNSEGEGLLAGCLPSLPAKISFVMLEDIRDSVTSSNDLGNTDAMMNRATGHVRSCFLRWDGGRAVHLGIISPSRGAGAYGEMMPSRRFEG